MDRMHNVVTVNKENITINIYGGKNIVIFYRKLNQRDHSYYYIYKDIFVIISTIHEE